MKNEVADGEVVILREDHRPASPMVRFSFPKPGERFAFEVAEEWFDHVSIRYQVRVNGGLIHVFEIEPGVLRKLGAASLQEEKRKLPQRVGG